ncbi:MULTISPECIES: integration host factor, actinobacterial type [unclassified Actinomyces]|uniref:integration host factor, actinobacterial type n=1 Tax=unclassified Actinomyces TaxID=2609248 RepID=UPI001373FA08|nr:MULTISPECIES: integration host factor, actinobacterial type [unclassified Actinomyces]MBW3070232.1 integration host factor MihF [Actinomyces sp. 594]NDR52700.1 integration host factor MihF [Actinomyces sp. 565]QHO90925.1 integration host factor MihF [Actinomyces sp. 432]
MVIPELTPGQRAAALYKAAAARDRRARAKAELKRGTLTVSALFEAAQNDEALAKMRALDLLRSLPRVGTVGAQALLQELGIAASRRVRGLGSRQRAELVRRFG